MLAYTNPVNLLKDHVRDATALPQRPICLNFYLFQKNSRRRRTEQTMGMHSSITFARPSHDRSSWRAMTSARARKSVAAFAGDRNCLGLRLHFLRWPFTWGRESSHVGPCGVPREHMGLPGRELLLEIRDTTQLMITDVGEHNAFISGGKFFTYWNFDSKFFVVSCWNGIRITWFVSAVVERGFLHRVDFFTDI